MYCKECKETEHVSSKHVELPQASELFNGILSPYVKKAENYLEGREDIIIFSVANQPTADHLFKDAKFSTR